MLKWIKRIFGGHGSQPALPATPPPGMPEFMYEWWKENKDITNDEMVERLDREIEGGVGDEFDRRAESRG